MNTNNKYNNKFNRIIYLGYYLKKLDKSKLAKFGKYTSDKTGKSKITLWMDAIICVFVYNISIIDYFLFGFCRKNKNERKQWAGTGFMYEFQLKMNPVEYRGVLENKLRFNAHFKSFITRKHAGIIEIKSNPSLLQEFLDNKTGKIVLKNAVGQIGAEVEIVNCSDFSFHSLIAYMEKNHFDLIEEFVKQHQDLMSLSPSGLNTIRVFTQLLNGKVDFLGARLRISVNSKVDNMAAGNLAAPVDILSGLVCGTAVYSDITKKEEEFHPVTEKRIVGFQIPYWEEVLKLVTKAALHTPENRSVGWDVAISQYGPELIEGNHNWCKILWQLPVKEGLKNELLRYL